MSFQNSQLLLLVPQLLAAVIKPYSFLNSNFCFKYQYSFYSHYNYIIIQLHEIEQDSELLEPLQSTTVDNIDLEVKQKVLSPKLSHHSYICTLYMKISHTLLFIRIIATSLQFICIRRGGLRSIYMTINSTIP